MSYSWSLAQLRTSVQTLGQYENSQDITPAVLLEVLNDALEETYNICIACDDDYYVKAGVTTTMVSGTDTYAVPTDLYNLRKVEMLDSTGRWIQLYPVPIDTATSITSTGYSRRRYRYRLSTAGLTFYPTPASSDQFRVWYIPLAPQLVNDTDTVTFDRPVERKLVLEIALRDCLQRQDLSIAEKQAQIDVLDKQLRTVADSHDSGEPFYLSRRGGAHSDEDEY